MKKTFLAILAAVLILAPAAEAQQGASQKAAEAAAAGLSMEGIAVPNRSFQPLPSPRFSGPRAQLINGTIQYDAGAVGTAGASSFCVGNQFDSAALNPLIASGSITMVQASMISVGGTAAFFSYFDQQAGTTAHLIDSVSVLGLAAGLNTFVPGLSTNDYVGNTFLAGMWRFNTDVPAVASGTTGGQGFHGMIINDIVATAFSRPGTFNAVLRVSGNVLSIPVELTGFEIVGD
jgi:hypothetical protein